MGCGGSKCQPAGRSSWNQEESELDTADDDKQLAKWMAMDTPQTSVIVRGAGCRGANGIYTFAPQICGDSRWVKRSRADTWWIGSALGPYWLIFHSDCVESGGVYIAPRSEEEWNVGWPRQDAPYWRQDGTPYLDRMLSNGPALWPAETGWKCCNPHMHAKHVPTVTLPARKFVVQVAVVDVNSEDVLAVTCHSLGGAELCSFAMLNTHVGQDLHEQICSGVCSDAQLAVMLPSGRLLRPADVDTPAAKLLLSSNAQTTDVKLLPSIKVVE